MNSEYLTRRIRRLLILFITGLVLSGLTAFPLEWELHRAHDLIRSNALDNPLTYWVELVHSGVHETDKNYPFIPYGTDWLAFAHLMIAVAFIGPLRHPVRNVWVIEFGLIACVSILPFAFIAGAVRGVPVYWRLIDCSFGIVGGLLLWSCYSKIKLLERLQQTTK